MKCLVIIPSTIHNHSLSAPLVWMFSKHIDNVTGIYGFELTEELVKSHGFFIIELNWFIQLFEFKLLVEYIKKENKDAKILFGGLYASLKYKEIFALFDVDYFIKGDNELPMEMFLESINPGKIPNLIGKNFENPVKYVFSKEDYRNIEFSLDWFPSYYQNIKENQDYQLPMIITSKGGCSTVHKGCEHCLGSHSEELKKIYNRPPIIINNDILINLLESVERKFESASLLFLSEYSYDFSSKYFDIDMTVEIDSIIPVDKIREILHAFKTCNLYISVYAEGLFGTVVRDDFAKILDLEDKDHQIRFYAYLEDAAALDIPGDHLLHSAELSPAWTHWDYYTNIYKATLFSFHFYNNLDNNRKFSLIEW